MATLRADQRRKLIATNAPLAFFLSQPFRGRGVEDEDLEQEALLGLCEAAGKFDPDVTPVESFGAFARLHIKGRLTRIVRRESRRRAWETALAESMVPAECDRAPEPGDMAELVRDALELLPAAQRRILELRFGLKGGEPLTVMETADRMRTSVAAVKRATAAARRVIGWALSCEGWTAESWARAGHEIFIRVG